MNKRFLTSSRQGAVNSGILFLRLAAAAFMLTHGYPKFQNLLAGGDYQFADPIGLGVTASLILTVFAEFFCSLLLAVGLATRFAALALAITMGVAAFVVHGADPFGRKEMALLYLCIYLFVLLVGPGRYSLDAFLKR